MFGADFFVSLESFSRAVVKVFAQVAFFFYLFGAAGGRRLRWGVSRDWGGSLDFDGAIWICFSFAFLTSALLTS